MVNTMNEKELNNKGRVRGYSAKERKAMEAKGLSQEALALEIEVDRTYIGKIERAERNVSLKMVGKIAKTLNVDVKNFF